MQTQGGHRIQSIDTPKIRKNYHSVNQKDQKSLFIFEFHWLLGKTLLISEKDQFSSIQHDLLVTVKPVIRVYFLLYLFEYSLDSLTGRLSLKVDSYKKYKAYYHFKLTQRDQFVMALAAFF